MNTTPVLGLTDGRERKCIAFLIHVAVQTSNKTLVVMKIVKQHLEIQAYLILL